MNVNLQRAKSLIQQGNYRLLMDVLKKQKDQDPINSILLYCLQHDLEKAKSAWLSQAQHLREKDCNDFKINLIQLLETCCILIAKQGKLKTARILIDMISLVEDNYQGLEIEKAFSEILSDLYYSAIRFAQMNEYYEAESRFKQILDVVPNDPQTLYNLSIVYYESNQLIHAYESINKALTYDPLNSKYFYMLGMIYTKQNDLENAINTYQHCITLEPNFLNALNSLGNIYKKLKQFAKAKKYYRQAIQQDPKHCGAFVGLGNLFISEKNYQDALAIYNQAHQTAELIPELFDGWIESLNCIGKTVEAESIGEKAIKLFPDDLFLSRKYHLLLPIIYQDSQDIEYYRNRFEIGLDILISQTKLESPSSVKSALKTICSFEGESQNNFYLTYQGKNDTKIQKKYSEYVYSIMTKAYPDFIYSLQSKTTTRTHSNKIRVGYISTRLHQMLGKLTLGWIKFADREKFEIYAYDVSDASHVLHNDYEIHSDYYYQLSSSLEEIVNQIINDKLNILVIVDIGMDSIMAPLACFRLAPVQCTTWAHPITSGLPTIDYFISSELMEPENGKEHYSETLVKLPNIGMSYEKPKLYPITLTRQDFALRTNSVVYLCCQSIFKYLPQYDYIFAEIASQVKNSQFVFLESNISKELNDIFKGRIKKHFDSIGLDFEHHILFLPFLEQEHYSIINQLSDIFLDTFSWSGGITTLKAIACGLPVVTCPGEFMRGRHSYGILRMLEIKETVANTEKEYVNISVRLGLNQQWRKEITHDIQKRLSNVYNDRVCVRALEKFYVEVTT